MYPIKLIKPQIVILIITVATVLPTPVFAQGGTVVFDNWVYLPIVIKSIVFTPNSTWPGSLNTHTTIESAGIVSEFTGDENNNNLAHIYYRLLGSSAWIQGPAMIKNVAAKTWQGNIVQLTPGTIYEIEVRYQDVDGVTPTVVTATINTRPNYPQIGSNGITRTVPTDGDLTSVINQAKPGDTVQLLSGVYYEDIVLQSENSGQAGKYITIEPAPGATVIFDGSDPTINGPGDDWTYYTGSANGDIYYVDLAWGDTYCDDSSPGYVGELIQQESWRYLLFDSGSDDWTADFLAAPPGKAYYVCDASGPGPVKRLYVITYFGADPDDYQMQVSELKRAIHLRGADYIRIRNFEFRHYSWSGVSFGYKSSVDGADHNIIEGNTFHGNGKRHIRIASGADNLIQNNYFYEKGYRDSQWQWDVEYNRARGGVIGIGFLYAGDGNVVRNNLFNGGHDGIQVNRQSSNVDISGNTINECMGDGIEIDNTPGSNIRVWNNRINYCYSGISIQDWNGERHGPVYIFRNVIVGGDDPKGRTDNIGGTQGYVTDTAFKVGSDVASDSQIYIYHNTISVTQSIAKGEGIKDSGGNYFSGAVTRNNIWRVTGRVYKLRAETAIVKHDFNCNNLHNLNSGGSTFITWSAQGGPNNDGKYINLAQFQFGTNQDLQSMSNTGTLFNADFHLQAGSPDIDAGCIIAGFNDSGPTAYTGLAPDIGAFEYLE